MTSRKSCSLAGLCRCGCRDCQYGGGMHCGMHTTRATPQISTGMTEPTVSAVAHLLDKLQKIRQHDGEPVSGMAEALAEILRSHQPKPVTVRHYCSRHSFLARRGLDDVLSDELSICSGCIVAQQMMCTGCNPLCPDDNVWPCRYVHIIAKAIPSVAVTGGAEGEMPA